jgi:hypothetical protein
LDFPTFDGAVDPLNWLNQCEKFFRGQRTLASDRTWLASYHLRGAAQTWYYALERDEGMPTWERFCVVCQMQFGPPTQGTRLAELARLPFTSTVQEYAERYNAVLCHTDDDLGPRQKAKLFVGGLPEHIRVDVEMRHPRIFRRQCTTHGRSSVALPRIRRYPRHHSAGHGRLRAPTPHSHHRGRPRQWRAPPMGLPGAGHHAILVPAIIPGRAAGAPTQGPLLQL